MLNPITRFAFVAVFAAVLGCCSSAHAELTWKQKTVSTTAAPTDEVLEITFPFKNTGKKAVDILQVESSCGCTTTELTERHYEPGKGGEIVARYTIGNHVGTQKKTVAVKSSDEAEPTILTLEAEIPELLRITPSFVTWSKGEEKKPKTMVVETVGTALLAEIKMQASNTVMDAKLEPTLKGHRYLITVTPAATDRFAFATLTLSCRFGKEAERSFRAYATVKPTVSSDE